LAWSPRLLAGTGLMEALVVHRDPEISRRLLKLLRVFASYQVSCPFCIDMNGSGFEQESVTPDEVRALASGKPWDSVGFSAAEAAALRYAACVCATPVKFPDAVVADLHRHFSDRAFTVIAATVAQVNFWARYIQSVGVSEAGFSQDLKLLELDRFRTRSESR
jgi:alkylhydroperoxidase family enzyme